MNIKLITKAMHTLSLLSEDDVQMVLKLRGLSEDERQMLMLVLEPGTKPSKKSSKKSASGGVRCAYVYGSGVPCNRMAATAVHINSQHVDYHEFQSPKSASKSKHASSLQSAITNRHGATNDRQRPTVATDDNEDARRCVYKLGEDVGGRPVICDATIDNNVHHKQTDPDYHQFKPAEQAAVASGD